MSCLGRFAHIHKFHGENGQENSMTGSQMMLPLPPLPNPSIIEHEVELSNPNNLNYPNDHNSKLDLQPNLYQDQEIIASNKNDSNSNTKGEEGSSCQSNCILRISTHQTTVLFSINSITILNKGRGGLI